MSRMSTATVTPLLARWRSPQLRLLLAGALAVLLAVAWGLAASRQQTLSAEAAVLRVLARAVAARLDSTLQAADATLRVTVADLQGERGSPLEPGGAALHGLLRERVLALPLFDTLLVLDAQGRVLASAVDPATGARLPQRLRMGSQLAGAEALESGFGLHQVELLAERSEQPARSAVAAVLPWHHAGRQGWVLALAERRFIAEALGQLSPEQAAVLALWRDEGQLLSAPEGRQAAANAADATQAWAALWPAHIERGSGQRPTMPAPLFSGSTGGQVLVLQPLPAHGFVVSVARPLQPVLAAWRLQLASVLGITVAGLLLAALFALRAARQAERVRAAENAARDAAERLALRQQASGRLEALGTLAGGIAHDVNNVLGAVIGWGEMAAEAAAPGSAQARHIAQVLAAGERGRALVQRLLDFGRPRSAARAERFDANRVVHDSLALLRGGLPAGIRLLEQLDAQPAELRGDPTRLFEILLNLVSNAQQAMPQGGELRVSSRRSASGWQLAVADTGVGIAPEHLSRLFDPFFTTREAQGTGLGLAVVQAAAQELGGQIEVQSRPGAGSCFLLQLPLPPAAVPPAAERPPAPGLQQSAGSTPRVLVLDDEPALVALAQAQLQALGYASDGFREPWQALQAVREAPERYALVYTDQLMPAMTGLALAERLRALAPTLPVLMASGSADAALAREAAALGVRQLLHKPVDRERLAQAVAQALGSPGPLA